MSHHEIALIGLSCVFPGADSAKEFWSNLINGVDAVGEVPSHRWRGSDNFKRPAGHEASLTCQRGGFLKHDIPFDSKKYGILPNAVKDGDPDQFFMLKIVDEALEDAGIAFDSPDRELTDLVVGNGGYTGQKLGEMLMRSELIGNMTELLAREFPESVEAHRDDMENFLRSRLPPNEIETISTCIPNIVASRAANRLNLGGAAYVVDAACASSLIAVEDAVIRLRAGRCRVAVAAGLFLKSFPTFWHVFSRLGALSPLGKIQPMDEFANGLVVGEGGGAVVLKRLEDAVADGDEIYAVLKGVGSSSDGREVDVLAPSKRGQLRALQRAYADANVAPETIGFLELHGTGTSVGDRVEAETIREFFGTSDLPATARCVGSVKSMIGHTMPAAGIASLIKAALSLANKTLPPSLHCEKPRPELRDSQFFVNVQTRPWIQAPDAAPRRAGVNTFGFGGINVHAILEEVTPATAPGIKPKEFLAPATRPSELVCFSARTVTELAKRLEKTLRFVKLDDAQTPLAGIGISLVEKFDSSAPVNLSIVACDLNDLERKLEACHAQLLNGKTQFSDPDIHFGSEETRVTGKLAVVFPGIAWPGLTGEYPDHLRELCLHYPEIRAEFDIFESRDRHPLDTTPTSAIFWPPTLLPDSYKAKLAERLAPPRTELASRKLSDDHPEERYLAAMGVTLSNWVSWLLLKKIGVQPDMLIGQSQGEMAALCAAGTCDFHESAPEYFKILDVEWGVDEMDRCAFVWCPIEKLEQRMKAYKTAHMAIYITPEAQLIGGTQQDLRQLADELRDEGHIVQILPYAPIHTPVFTYLRREMTRIFSQDTLSLHPPQIPIYSAITEDLFPNDDKSIRETLARNLDEPVRMWQTLCRMYDDGARVFVQVGGGQLATSLDQMLPDRNEVHAVALENEAVNPITQLNRMCGQLLTFGVPVELSALFERRGLQCVDLEDPSPKRSPLVSVPIRLDWNVFDGLPPKSEYRVPVESASSRIEQGPPNAASSEKIEEQPSTSFETPSEVEDSICTVSVDHLPMVGELVSYVPEVECRTRRVLALNEDLYLADHVLVNCEGLKPLEECVPVLPMTFGIETIAEAASILAPGLGLVGFRNIRASRWIRLEETSTLPIDCHARKVLEPRDDGRVAVDVTITVNETASLSGTVLFGEVYESVELMPAVPGMEDEVHTEWPMTTEEVYEHKYLFHGPSLQIVSRLGLNGDRLFGGELTVPDKSLFFASHPQPCLLADPALLDAVGQMVGLWTYARGNYILPIGVEQIDFFQPTPPDLTVVSIWCEAVEFNQDLKRCKFNVWVDNGHGEPWMHCAGWSDFLFDWDQQTSNWLRSPRHYVLGSEVERPDDPESVLMCVTTKNLPKSLIDSASLSGLTRVELDELRSIENLKERQHFVMSRVAAKDATRVWLSRFRQGSAVPHPVELQVINDEAGRPWIALNGEFLPLSLSISHRAGNAVAIVCAEEIGLDLEPACSIDPSLAEQILTDTESELISTVTGGEISSEWLTRVWCAKEAVAKRLGTGLQGRPKDFVAVDIDPYSKQILIRVAGTDVTEIVSTYELGSLLIAVTAGRRIATQIGPQLSGL